MTCVFVKILRASWWLQSHHDANVETRLQTLANFHCTWVSSWTL